MKNLKKVLSLVLALAMALSLMTVAFAKEASDYNDYDKVTNKEAVEVLTSLEVIDGMGGGFNPTGNVTRAQMAKMITIISLGNVDASAFLGTATDLKDINGHWAEAYIKYCYSQGIISGRGNGIFDPNANVTSAEAAKMLLTAIGYSAKVQGYTGAQWAINVTRDAQLSGFYDGVSVPSNKALTRDEAAQMIYNAVAANTIRQQKSQNLETGAITISYIADGAPLLTKTFSTKEYVGVLTSITYASANKEYTYNASSNFENKVDNTDKSGYFTAKADYTAFEGEEVTAIVKTEKNGDRTVLGIYPTGKGLVVTSNVSALEADGSKLKVNGTSYECEGAVSTGLVDANSYDTIKLVDSDNNGKLDTAIRTVYTPAKVTYVSDKEIIAGGTTYKIADNEIPSGLAKDDYVAVVKKLNGAYVLTKLTAIEGKVTSDKTGDNLIEVNGTWYNDENAPLTLGTTYKFYAVNGVVVTGSATVVSGASINNLVMVLDADNTTNVLNAQAIIMDSTGVKKTVTVDKSGVAPAAGSLYMYEETSAGYKFATPSSTSDGKYTWAPNSAGVSANGTTATVEGVTVADDAVIFVYCSDGKNGTVITGKQLKSLTSSASTANTVLTAGKGSFTSTVSGLSRVSYAGVEFKGKLENLGVTNGNTNYAYVTADSYEVKLDNDTYVTYSIWNGSENVTVFEKGTTARAKGTVLKYDTIDNNKKITGVSAYTLENDGFNNTSNVDLEAEVAAIQGIEGDYVYLDGVAATNSAKRTKDTAYLYIDSNASKAEEIGLAAGEVILADKNAGQFKDNVIAVVNTSDEVVLLVVDVKNNMNTSTNATLGVTMTGLTGTYAQATASKDTGLKAGDIITITLKNDAADVAGGRTITLTGAKYLDGTDSGASTISVDALTKGNSVTYSLVVTGAVSFRVA